MRDEREQMPEEKVINAHPNYYFIFFMLGIASLLLGFPIGSLLQSVGGGVGGGVGGFIVALVSTWVFLITAFLFVKAPKAVKTALLASIFILILNLYLFYVNGANFAYFLLCTFFTPLFPLPVFTIILLIFSFFTKNETRFALRAIAISYIGLAIAINAPLFMALLMGTPTTDVVAPPKTTTIRIDKLDCEPEHYSELCEEDLEKYPILKEALKEIEGGKTRVQYEVPRDVGQAIANYLIEKQDFACCSPYLAQFKYKGGFYGFNLVDWR